MGGWYAATGLYVPEELDGLTVREYRKAVAAEGAPAEGGVNAPLHVHPALTEADIYGHGKPTRLAFATRDVSQAPESLPVALSIDERVYNIPCFRHYRPESIERYAAAYRKVALQADKLRDA